MGAYTSVFYRASSPYFPRESCNDSMSFFNMYTPYPQSPCSIPPLIEGFAIFIHLMAMKSFLVGCNPKEYILLSKKRMSGELAAPTMQHIFVLIPTHADSSAIRWQHSSCSRWDAMLQR